MYFYIKGTPAVKSYSYDNSPYGTYCIGGNINTFYIQNITGVTTCTPTSGTGTLNITSVNTTTRKISGNFSATLQCSGSYPISGTFTDISY